MELLYVKMSSKAHSPTRATPYSAGLDLKSAEYKEILPHQRQLVCTNLKIKIPEGHYGRIAPRSGLSIIHKIDTCAGVIDADYRGEIKIVLHNHGEEIFQVKPGERVAQLICEKISLPTTREVPSLSDTERGQKGFGSSGST